MGFWDIFSFLRKEEIKEDPMKYLIVGLGNIGSEYDRTRHNVGFEVVDYMATEKDAKWKVETLGSIAEVKAKGRTYILLKPSTYMNLSGKAVRYWMTKHKIQIDNILIITDDKNLPFGKQRLRGKGSDGGHNGLKDIQAILATSSYPRLRFGIGSEFYKGNQVDFVLGKWSSDESEAIPELIKDAADTIYGFGFLGLSRAMNQFNKK